MRSNLLSLQNIAGQVDLTQNRLSTGLKVNSAIDNPSSYYTAVSLNNRASDLSSLLDSMAQGIQTIKAATEGLEAGAKLLEQASATATQALETVNVPSKSWFEAQEGVAAVVSTKEEFLAAIDSGKKGDIVIYGQIDMGNTAITLQEGQNLTGIGTYGVADNERGKFSALNFDVTGLASMQMITLSTGNISDLSISAEGDANKQAFALIQATGKSFSITLKNVDFHSEVKNGGWGSSLVKAQNKDAGQFHLQGVNNLYTTDNITGFWQTSLTIDSGTVLNAKLTGVEGATFAYSNVEINDAQVNSQTSYWDFLRSSVICNGKSYVNGGRSANGSLTLNDQSRVDNCARLENMNLNITSREATINVTEPRLFVIYSSGTATLNAVAGSKISLAGQVYRLDENVDYTQTVTGTPPQCQKVDGETFVQPDRSFLDSLTIKQKYEPKADSSRYQEIIRQYDSLIKDSSYKGINLLGEQDLTVIFNEDRSAQLAVKGKDASSKALGLTTVDWQNQGDIKQSLQELTDALNQIRQISSELGNYYSIVTTREDFTQNLINVLTEGADKLTLADMNEESANMLALQTRQQLAVNSLSLASQASQSILRLF